MQIRLKPLKAAVVAVMVALGGTTIDPATSDAAGRRAASAELQRSARLAQRPIAKRSAPRPAATRTALRRTASSPRSTAGTRAAARRPVSIATRARPGPRIAGFVQRAAPRRQPATVARAAIPAQAANPSTFVNGYRDLSFTQFRTGDFFDHPQLSNGQ